ncbi:DinB family protein [Flavisolibacter sp. BT320]|nr:DinB family protein [Flavisolibacter longurius]
MNNDVILAEWQQTTDRLSTLILSFSPEIFFLQSSPARWSAAQQAEHLLKVDMTTYQALKSETVPTNRPPDQKIPLIREAMESDTKRIAPERVQPSATKLEPQAIAAQIIALRQKLAGLIRELDLSEACRVYKHPSLGTLTRREWVYFNIHHAGRHIRQMEELKEAPAS